MVQNELDPKLMHYEKNIVEKPENSVHYKITTTAYFTEIYEDVAGETIKYYELEVYGLNSAYSGWLILKHEERQELEKIINRVEGKPKKITDILLDKETGKWKLCKKNRKPLISYR